MQKQHIFIHIPEILRVKFKPYKAQLNFWNKHLIKGDVN